MELNWLRYFYEVARLQSVTQAGRHLRISQPAVTKVVRQLETQVGYKLFAKAGRHLRLTQEGERLYQHCIPIFKRLEQLKGLSYQTDAEWEGTIRLGASDNLTHYVLPKVVAKMQLRYPRADWNVYTGSSKEIKQKIITGEIDLGLFYTDLSLSEQRLLKETKLADVTAVAVCSSKLGKKISVDRLRKLNLTYVGVRFADYANTLPEHWIVKQLKVEFSRNIQANSKEAQKRMVLEGAGFGIFPKFMVEKELKDKTLTLVQGSERPMTLRMALRNDESLTNVHENLIESLKSLL